MSAGISLERAAVRKTQMLALAAACLAMVAAAAGGFFVSPVQFFRAYLAAYLFFLGVALGSMALLMLYYMTGGAWGFLIRRVLEALSNTLPLLALLFVPIGFGVPWLYLWAQPERVAHDAELQRQQFYLNQSFFLWRAVIYFAIWIATSFWLRYLSRRQALTGDPRLPWKMQRASEIGLVLFGTSIHFAAFDWIEMLQPSVHSTIFPFVVASGQVLSGQAAAILAFVWFAMRTDAAEAASTRAFNDLGNLLFAFLIVWAYMVWFQFMLMWMANLPTDAEWILPRARGGWVVVTWALFLAHFVVPFFLLLGRPVKRRPRALMGVAALILAMQLVFDYYQVLPAFPSNGIQDHWIDFLTPIAVGGFCLADFLNQLTLRPLLEFHDPARHSAAHLRAIDLEEADRERAMALE